MELSNYPNPTKHHLTLEFLGYYEEIKAIETYNIQGQNINIPYSIEPTNSYLTKIIFNTELIEAGTYFISLTNTNDITGRTTIIKY